VVFAEWVRNTLATTVAPQLTPQRFPESPGKSIIGVVYKHKYLAKDVV